MSSSKGGGGGGGGGEEEGSIIATTEFFEFAAPNSLCPYPFETMFPEKETEMRSVRNRVVRTVSLPSLNLDYFIKIWMDVKEPVWGHFEIFISSFTRFCFRVMGNWQQETTNTTTSDSILLYKGVPQFYEWHSSFDTKVYKSTCILFELIMLWHTKALLHYNKALVIENSIIRNRHSSELIYIPQTQVNECKKHMTIALKVWSVMCRMFIQSWKTRNESFLPLECTMMGNSFFSRVAILKLQTYELLSFIVEKIPTLLGLNQSLTLDYNLVTDIIKDDQLLFCIDACKKIAYSTKMVQRFLATLKHVQSLSTHFRLNEKGLLYHHFSNGKSISVTATTTTTYGTDFSIYEIVCILLYSTILLDDIKKRKVVLDDHYQLISFLYSFGTRLIKQQKGFQKYKQFKTRGLFYNDGGGEEEEEEEMAAEMRREMIYIPRRDGNDHYFHPSSSIKMVNNNNNKMPPLSLETPIGKRIFIFDLLFIEIEKIFQIRIDLFKTFFQDRPPPSLSLFTIIPSSSPSPSSSSSSSSPSFLPSFNSKNNEDENIKNANIGSMPFWSLLNMKKEKNQKKQKFQQEMDQTLNDDNILIENTELHVADFQWFDVLQEFLFKK